MRRAVLVATLVLAGCGGDDEAGGAVEAMVLETCAPGREPVEVQVCECAYDAVRERFDGEAIERLDGQLRDDPGTVPPELQELVLECAFTVVAPPTTKPPSTTTTTPRPTSTTRSTSTTTSTTRPRPTSTTADPAP